MLGCLYGLELPDPRLLLCGSFSLRVNSAEREAAPLSEERELISSVEKLLWGAFGVVASYVLFGDLDRVLFTDWLVEKNPDSSFC